MEKYYRLMPSGKCYSDSGFPLWFFMETFEGTLEEWSRDANEDVWTVRTLRTQKEFTQKRGPEDWTLSDSRITENKELSAKILSKEDMAAARKKVGRAVSYAKAKIGSHETRIRNETVRKILGKP